MENLITPIITGIVSITVCVINNVVLMNKTHNLIEYKLDELTKRVDKHNNVIERTYILEKDSEVLKHEIKVANHRIEDLENEAKK